MDKPKGPAKESRPKIEMTEGSAPPWKGPPSDKLAAMKRRRVKKNG